MLKDGMPSVEQARARLTTSYTWPRQKLLKS